MNKTTKSLKQGLMPLLVLFLMLNSSCAMSKNLTSNQQQTMSNQEKKTFRFEDYKSVEEALKIIRNIYPAGSDLDKIVEDLNLNKLAEINDPINGRIISYNLYDGSKNAFGYNYWRLSIHLDRSNKINQIFVSSGDYQGL